MAELDLLIAGCVGGLLTLIALLVGAWYCE